LDGLTKAHVISENDSTISLEITHNAADTVKLVIAKTINGRRMHTARDVHVSWRRDLVIVESVSEDCHAVNHADGRAAEHAKAWDVMNRLRVNDCPPVRPRCRGSELHLHSSE
jgi:hypothetical protein